MSVNIKEKSLKTATYGNVLRPLKNVSNSPHGLVFLAVCCIVQPILILNDEKISCVDNELDYDEL